ncbi:ABC transporter substrate-binding protein [Natranaeroarchaeum sulfidigenes]|uniref:ABC-type nitrate/sulfonate/bicarbonate transportsystem, periplasmic component n=1 Tax=Natranaeroarchaeum sulfidigenes TaxID=2784880 RepID=A0A897MSC1_9EURY|nr:ABC transporter substrate-binding protein [Natranaeroarchaeum sulfidigenes]QSG01859.1 ABC-type nitrate/sulfonate/bicarbonate transportsystem, periplasmic component [Natranaeroarchaeum sulfidigenes]
MQTTLDRSLATSRRRFLGVAAGASTVSLVGCLDAVGGDDTESASYRHRFERSGLASAVNDGGIALGSWEEENLSVEFRESSGSQAAVQSVNQGEDEFGNADTGAVLQAIEEGADLTMIGHVLEPMDGVVALDDAGISSWSDLEGETVGVFPWSIQGDLVRIAMQRNGADPDGVEFQDVQPGAHNTLLRQGELDANISYWPQSKVRLENEGYDVDTLDIATELNHLGVCLFTRDELVTDRPEFVGRFVRGWLRAHRSFVTDLEAVIDAHREQVVEFDEELERQTLGYIYESRVPTREIGEERGKGWIPAEKMENTRDVLTSIDYIEGEIPIEDTYTNEFIQENTELSTDTAEIYYEELESTYDREIE